MDNKCSFMDIGVINIYIDDVTDIIEDLSSPEALEYVHTINVSMDTLCENNDLRQVLTTFISKTKITKVRLQQCGNYQIYCVIDFLKSLKDITDLSLFLLNSEYNSEEISSLQDYFSTSTQLVRLYVLSNYEIVQGVMGIVSSFKTITTIKLNIIATDSSFEQIIETVKLLDAPVTKFHIKYDSFLFEPVEYIENTFAEIFANNYTLVDFCASLKIGPSQKYTKIHTNPITDRNASLVANSRFIKTKVAPR